jgi:hypothetical protein
VYQSVRDEAKSMKTGNNPNEFDISLIQQQAQRQLMVEKMRGKLAGHSQSFVQAKERQAYATRKRALVLGWRLALLGAFLLGNFYYISSRPDAPAKEAVKKAPRLPAPPATMNVNDQAMYWTLALYDFDQLKSRFGVGERTIVDAGAAKRKLKELLPKVDARTRFAIDRMVPPERTRK